MWEYRAAPLRVLDGDTLRVLADLGFYARHQVDIRLKGVLAPKLWDPGGPEALAAAESWVDGLWPATWPLLVHTEITTSVEPVERQSFTRYIGEVRDINTGSSLNATMIEFLGAARG